MVAEHVTVNIQTALVAQVHITTISMSSEHILIHLAHLVVCDVAMLKPHRSNTRVFGYR
jgi:hypothetical protein